MPSELSQATLYFGYGSNLWQQQMKQRCPTSEYLGIGRLSGYRWIIYERGYANIVEISHNKDPRQDSKGPEDEVWGLVYSLQADDETRLDRNESVPLAYTKELISINFFEARDNKSLTTLKEKPKQKRMLVYINRDQTKESKPKHEYIYRMNMGIKDALREGVPKKYVDKVLRKFIPDVEDKNVEEIARKQASEFEDER